MAVKPATPFDGVAWVTGASTGIGAALAIKLAKRGWRVAVTARNEEKLQELKASLGEAYGEIIVKPGDVTDPLQMAKIIEALATDEGGIGLAVLNAGIYEPINGNELDIATFEKTISVNLNGTVNCLVPLSSHMWENGRGQIVITSSVAGYGGLPTSAAYGMTKAGLINLAESLKFDFDKMGILIQVVNPGFVDTPATASNPFEMPFLMEVEEAAEKMLKGLEGGKFEITFPKQFTHFLKFTNAFPYFAYFPLVNWFTKWKQRPLEGADDLAKTRKHPPKHW